MNPDARQQLPHLLAIALAVIIPLVCGLVVWFSLTPVEQSALVELVNKHPSLVVTSAFLLLATLVLAVHWVFQHYIDPLRTLAEDIRLITSTNPSHRVTEHYKGDMFRLGQAINTAADRFQQLQTNVNEQIQEANAESEKEKNTLATLIQELTDGVVVCNNEGQILLYNKRTRQLLSSASTGNQHTATAGGILGLGRSIFGAIDRILIVHALEELGTKLANKDSAPVSHFATTGAALQLLRVQTVPILDDRTQMTGFILVLNDITQRMEHDSRRDQLLQSLTEEIRSSLGTIRLAVESMHDYPAMDATQRERFVRMLRDESFALSEHLEGTTRDYSQYFKSQWPLEDILCADLLAALKRGGEQTLDVHITTENIYTELWVKVDSYSLLQAMLFMVNEIKRITGIIEFSSRAMSNEGFVTIDIVWKGQLLPSVTLREWESQPLIYQGRGIPATLRDVLQRHDAELWSQSEKDQRDSYIRLMLPASSMSTTAEGWHAPATVASRPEFYDFDLFQRPGQETILDNQPLAEIPYTAFDTETTGLDPRSGDEIISIGAVRIVNQRLLQQEVFDQLIDPRRALSPQSIHVHGILPEMLEGQPTIDRVLPGFQKFADGTVLVAHNAAFDMRFFQMKETATGVKILNPVLDTLLLSAVAHPNRQGHDLEQIATRVGVNIIGRHTALGDAILTGEVLLKLIPILAERGVRTLRDAQLASKKTFYARIKY
jgi:DNA polymerase III subunit epsilon